MATLKDKPIGYYKKLLAMDCETSGLAINTDDPSYDPESGKEYQSVSWGLIIASAHTLKPIEELYVEIKWNGDSQWDMRAQAVHGLTLDYLEDHALDEEDAVAEMANLIVKHFGTDSAIKVLGHNVVSFDLWFMKRLMRRHGIELRFGNRHVDTSTIGFVNYEVYTSDQLFELIGFDAREDHNALDDARMSLEAARQSRIIFNSVLNG